MGNLKKFWKKFPIRSIIYIENGEIKEEGTHDQLMEAGSSYSGLFNIQSHYYTMNGHKLP